MIVNFSISLPPGVDVLGNDGLTVDNVFNVSPQMLLRPNNNNPNYNGWTLGRVIKSGFSAKF